VQGVVFRHSSGTLVYLYSTSNNYLDILQKYTMFNVDETYENDMKFTCILIRGQRLASWQGQPSSVWLVSRSGVAIAWFASLRSEEKSCV
jgi:hypothetical protein